MEPIFVAGIDTNVGKTIVAAILTQALKADYWKPIQCGNLNDSDTNTVQQLVSNGTSTFHPEAYRLPLPMSPHIAASRAGVSISLDLIKAPTTNRPLIIEGAGGLLVPLNQQYCVIDMIQHLGAQVVLVSRNYLGSINHTLLSAQALKAYNIPVKGIIFNGEPMEGTEEIILHHTGYKCLGYLDEEPLFTPEIIAQYAQKWLQHGGI